MQKNFYITKDSISPTSNVFSIDNFGEILKYRAFDIDQHSTEQLDANNLIRISTDVDSVNVASSITANLVNGVWQIDIEYDSSKYNERLSRYKIKILSMRKKKMDSFAWRYERYSRNERLGLPQIDILEELDAYMKAWADITDDPKFPFVNLPKYKDEE